MNPTLSSQEIKKLVSGKLADPFSVLGAHSVSHNNNRAVAVRIFLPEAQTVSVMDLLPDKEVAAHLIHKHGLFEAILPESTAILPYRLRVDFGVDLMSTFYDCYSFLPVLKERDLFLFNQGND